MLLLSAALVAHTQAATLDIDVFTALPTEVGLRATGEGPGRLRLSLSGGVLPGPYLDEINREALANDWYDEQTVALIEQALRHSAIFGAHLGWRPFPKHGLQAEAGWGYMGLGGGLTGAQVLSAGTGYDLSWLGDIGYDYSVRASLQRIEGTVGWEWVVAHHVHLRLDVGWSQTVAVKADVQPDFDVPWVLQGYEDDMEAKTEADLKEDLAKINTPILALGAGWRF